MRLYGREGRGAFEPRRVRRLHEAQFALFAVRAARHVRREEHEEQFARAGWFWIGLQLDYQKGKNTMF